MESGHWSLTDVSIKDLMDFMSKVLENEDSLNVAASPFRMSILVSQVGDLNRYISHDDRLNKTKPRPHGTRDDEISTFGHAFIQLAAVAASRGFGGSEIQSGINMAMQAMREKDWAIVERGLLSVSPGIAYGVLIHEDDMEAYPNEKLIIYAEHLRARYLPKNVVGILTRHGGTTCHAAIIARENLIPCITGVKGEELKFGKTYDIISYEGEVEVTEA